MHGNVFDRVVFDRVVTAAIGVNTVVLVLSLFDEAHREVLERIDTALLWMFALEIATRFKRAGRRCLRDRWLLFDTLVIAVALARVGPRQPRCGWCGLRGLGTYSNTLAICGCCGCSGLPADSPQRWGSLCCSRR